MKVILTQDVKDLGKKDSMVDVSDGHARNYLFPRRLAIEANAGNMNIMKQKNAAEKNKKNKQIEAANALVATLAEVTVTLKAKGGENGKLFGSITNKEIAEKLLADHKLDIDKKKIHLTDPIKSVGTFEVEVKIYPEISGKLKVVVDRI
ncbi:MAG: 50S ribosomal protein L9 [Clostridia bacterium]